ncbi:hypothetical protein [Lentzea sp.]|uniref:hypothetical protein n=1 Tax=Lentzea sp. TaxID=56099 RepID=UPI002ECFF190
MTNTALRTLLVGATAAVGAIIGLAAPASAAPAGTGVVAVASTPGDRVDVLGLHFTAFDPQGRPTAGYDDNDDTFTVRYFSNGYVFWRWSYGCEFLYDASGALVQTECL